MVSSNGQHSRRLDVVARRLHDPEKELTLEHVTRAIPELERHPETTTLLGMPIDRLMSLVEAEIARLETELEER